MNTNFKRKSSTNPKTITIKDIPFEILDVKASGKK